MRYETGTLALMEVRGGRIQKASLIRGDQAEVDAHNAKLKSDPVTGELGELGFGTQELPVSGRDIQDEKVLGTMHVATGRSDHLGGHLVPELFKDAKNATHDDILFAPAKTPEIEVTQVRMQRGGRTEIVLEHFQPAPYLLNLMKNG
jgi:aminopeptidase